MNICQSNTYRKDFSWLHFDSESRVQKRQPVKNQQSCVFAFIVYLIFPGSSDMTTVFHARLFLIFIEIRSNLRRKTLQRMNQSSNFLGGNFSNSNNVRAQIQFRRLHPSILKDEFSSKTDPSICTSFSPVKQSKLSQSTVSPRSDSSSEANSSC